MAVPRSRGGGGGPESETSFFPAEICSTDFCWRKLRALFLAVLSSVNERTGVTLMAFNCRPSARHLFVWGNSIFTDDADCLKCHSKIPSMNHFSFGFPELQKETMVSGASLTGFPLDGSETEKRPGLWADK